MNLIDLAATKTATHVIDIVPQYIKECIVKAAKSQRPVDVGRFDGNMRQWAIVRNNELYLIDRKIISHTSI
jgi:hypothetical protein